VLAFASSFAIGDKPIDGLYTTLIAAGYVGIMLFVVHPLLVRMNSKLHVAPRLKAAEAIAAAAAASAPPAVVEYAPASSPPPHGTGVSGATGSSPAVDSAVAAVAGTPPRTSPHHAPVPHDSPRSEASEVDVQVEGEVCV
jgi:hypothetical protein